MGAAVSYSAVRQVLQQTESDPIMVDSQEAGSCGEDEPKIVLHRVLRHLLQQVDQSQASSDTMHVAEEYLDLMQDILLKSGRQPLKRGQEGALLSTSASSSTSPPATQGEHVVKFMRRQPELCEWRRGCYEQEDTDMTSMMDTERPWRKRPRVEATSSTRLLAPKPTPHAESAETPEEEEAPVDSVGGGETLAPDGDR